MEKIYSALIAIGMGFSLPCFAQDGSLDLSFDTDGKVMASIGTFDDAAKGIVALDNGKILIAGHSYTANSYDFAVMQFLEDGSIDSSFSVYGYTTFGINTNEDRANCLAVQPDGKILVGGFTNDGLGDLMMVVRLLPTGEPDLSFGTNAAAIVPGNPNQRVESLVLQGDGKIVLTGGSSGSGNNDLIMVRLNADGSLDNTFSTDGIVVTPVSANLDDYGYSVKLQPDGKILVGGFSFDNTNANFLIARYNTDGSLDNTFDGDGIVTAGIFGSFNEYGYALDVQPDGKILLAGYIDNSYYDFIIIRINSDGNLDLSWGNSGVVYTDWGTVNDYGAPVDLIVQIDGKVLVGGYHSIGSDIYFALAKYQMDGSLDTTFDADGKVTTDFEGIGDAVGYSLALQQDGKILLAGAAYNSQNYFAIARYHNTIGSPVGLAETTTNSSVQSFPNPSNNQVHFQFKNPCQNGELLIYNTNGQLVKHITDIQGSTYLFAKKELPAGMYSYRIMNNNSLLSQGRILLQD